MAHTHARTLCLSLALLGAGCATYTDKTDSAWRDFERGHFEAARKEFRDPDVVDSAFLRGAEAGSVAFVAGDYEGALSDFHDAATAAADIEGRALAGPERLGEGLASWVLNDTARAYEGEGFERVYVHSSLALAYLALGKLEDVYVEARLGNQLLEAEETLYQKKYAAGGLGHLISALAYELLGELDHAYIDYGRMAAKEVGTGIAGPALVRLAERLNRDDELEEWRDRFGGQDAEPWADSAASVVVLAGVGSGPVKVEGRLVIPTHDGVISVSGVQYQRTPPAVRGLRVGFGARSQDTSMVEDVTRIAIENLSDRQVWLWTKSAARGVLKRELTKKLEDEYGTGGRIAGDLFSVFSERADLRHWRTLPDSWHATRLFVPPGVGGLTLEALGGERVDLGDFELEPGETMFVFARSLGTRLHATAIGGRPVGRDE